MSKDKKPTTFDLFNDDSLWGNQETDSLSHEELLDPNWNRKRTKAQKERLSVISKKLNAERKKDKKLMAKISAKISAKGKGKKISRASVKKMLETKRQKGILHNPSWNKGIAHSESTKKKLSKANMGKKLDSATKEKIAKNCAKNKSIETPEGIFVSMSAAGRHYWDNQLTTRSSYASTRMWVREQIMSAKNKDFYFIKND